MQTLERRIASLELASPDQSSVNTIILVPMEPEGQSIEIHRLRAEDGAQHWSRRPVETEEQFKDRATGELDRKGRAVVMMIGEAA